MRVSEQDAVLSDCVHEFSCLYNKWTPEYHQRDVTGNCWKEVANKAGLEDGKIPFVIYPKSTPDILKVISSAMTPVYYYFYCNS